MKRIMMMAAAVLALAPAAAFAQTTKAPRWFAVPFATFNSSDNPRHASMSVGVSGGFASSTWWAIEGDVADAPQFFSQSGFLTNRRVTTAMGNLVVRKRQGESRYVLYALGGLGLVCAHATEAGAIVDVTQSSLGWNAGGGVVIATSERIGVRGDVRYVHTAHTPDAGSNPLGSSFSSFGFIRVSGGLLVRF